MIQGKKCRILFILTKLLALAWTYSDAADGACSGDGPTGQAYGSDWGAAPSSGNFVTVTCLTVTNDQDFAREEVAYSGIPLSQDLAVKNVDLDRLVVVGANNRRIPAQFDVLSRWAGPLSQTSKPIRWLQVSLPVDMEANTNIKFDLRFYDQPEAQPLSDDVSISDSGGGIYVVTTGSNNLAQFQLNNSLGAIIEAIALGGQQILSHSSNNAGPSITFVPQKTGQYGSTPRTLTADQHGSITYFEVSESGPVKTTVLAEGVWSDPTGASLCNTFSSNNPAPYESFTYSLALTFFRGKTDIKVQFHVRNQCSNGRGGSWTDQTFLIDKASYTLDFSTGISPSSASYYYGGSNSNSVGGPLASGSARTCIVEQRKGSGSPWKRRARVTHTDTGTAQSAEVFNAPIVAVSNNSFIAAATLGHMRYREPQALRVQGSLLSIDVVSERQRVGEGKGLWNHGMFLLLSGSANRQNILQTMRWPAVLQVGKYSHCYINARCVEGVNIPAD